MCLILVAWQSHPDYPLVVAANRDEFFARPAAAAAFWNETRDVLAGRDLEAGGTWLGVSRQGRFAALTNYREGGKQKPTAPSRGALVADFLAGNTDPDTYLAGLAARGAEFNGFNLFVSDGQTLGYYANRGAGPLIPCGDKTDTLSTSPCRATALSAACLRVSLLSPQGITLPPGIYGLSNHLLDTPWPKLAAAKTAFTQALASLPAEAPFFDLLADREIVPDEHLPETGVPLEWERCLSAIFVDSPKYGTRASTVLTVRKDGLTTFVERSFGPAALPLGEVRERFQSLYASEISTAV